LILEGHKVEACPLGQLCECHDLVGPLVLRGDERAEGEIVAVVGHLVVANGLPQVAERGVSS
jgi:hypothetical protein